MDDEALLDVAATARALLSYYNRELAEALAKRILKSTNKTTWARFSANVMAMVQDAGKQLLWQQVCDVVRRAGESHIGSGPFFVKVQEQVVRMADTYIPEAVRTEVRMLVQQRVQQFLKQHDTNQWLKEAPGRFKEVFETELRAEARRLAGEAAAKLAASP